MVLFLNKLYFGYSLAVSCSDTGSVMPGHFAKTLFSYFDFLIKIYRPINSSRLFQKVSILYYTLNFGKVTRVLLKR